MDACKCQIITIKQIMNITNWDQAKKKHYKNKISLNFILSFLRMIFAERLAKEFDVFWVKLSPEVSVYDIVYVTEFCV